MMGETTKDCKAPVPIFDAGPHSTAVTRVQQGAVCVDQHRRGAGEAVPEADGAREEGDGVRGAGAAGGER
jgi:hypothetical protein